MMTDELLFPKRIYNTRMGRLTTIKCTITGSLDQQAYSRSMPPIIFAHPTCFSPRSSAIIGR